MTTGKVDATLFRYPLNAIAGGVFLFFLIMVYAASRKAAVLQWFYSLTASITSLTAWMVLVIIMGLTRQVAPSATVTHGGLLSGLGFMQMTVSQGEPEWRATDEAGEMQELPLAIELKSFTIDEYPPKLLIIDNADGKALPEKNPENILVESTPLSGNLLDWEIEVTDLLPMAACVPGKDTVNFVAFHSEGATTALYVTARNKASGVEKSGWVSCGSFMFPYVSLQLNEEVSLVMPEREPKRFASEVLVYTKEKEQAEALIEVNKPFSMSGWKIYQLSYDETKGKWSRLSIFELVKDPWLPLVYTGILMMLLGSVCLFILAPGNKPEQTVVNDIKTV